MNRNQIHDALFAKLQTVPGIVVSSQRVRLWDDLNVPDFPALFTAQGGEVITRKHDSAPPVAVIHVDVLLYTNTGGDHTVNPYVQLNELIDAVFQALKPATPFEKQTLGLSAVVQHCWIEGTIETSGGQLGDIAVASIPVVILATDYE